MEPFKRLVISVTCVVLVVVFFFLTAFVLYLRCCRTTTELIEDDGITDRLLPQEREFQRKLRENYVILGDNMDTESGLTSHLYSKGVISIREKQTIHGKRTDFDKNETLLNLMMRKTEQEFYLFIDALKESNQTHLARTLLGDGVVLPVHVNIETKLPVNVKEFEKQLVVQLNTACVRIMQNGTNLGELEILVVNLLSDIRSMNSQLLKTVPDRSILFYFFCPSVEALDRVKVDCQRGRISESIDRIVALHLVQTSLKLRSRGFKFSHGSIQFAGNGDVEADHGGGVPLGSANIHIDAREYQRCRENFSPESRLLQSIKLVIYLRKSVQHWRTFRSVSERRVF